MKGGAGPIAGRVPAEEAVGERFRSDGSVGARSRSEGTVDVRFPFEGTVGVWELLDDMAAAPRPAVGDERVLEFLVDVGRRLRAPDVVRRHPELASLGFFLRRSGLERAAGLPRRNEPEQAADSHPPSERRRAPGFPRPSGSEVAGGAGEFVRVPRGLVFHIAPANVDTVFVYSWALSALMGNRNVVRLSARAGVVAEVILHVMREALDDADPVVRRTQRIVSYDHPEPVPSNSRAPLQTGLPRRQDPPGSVPHHGRTPHNHPHPDSPKHLRQDPTDHLHAEPSNHQHPGLSHHLGADSTDRRRPAPTHPLQPEPTDKGRPAPTDHQRTGPSHHVRPEPTEHINRPDPVSSKDAGSGGAAGPTAVLSAACDLRVIWGGDRTVNEIRRHPLAPHARDLAFPDRSSFAVIRASAWLEAAPATREAVADGFAVDAYWFDQAACSSPGTVFWVGCPAECDAARDGFATCLAQAVARRGWTVDTAMAVEKRVAAYGLAADGVADAVEFRGNALAQVVLTAPGAAPRRWLGTGTFAHARLGSLDELADVVRRKDQTLTHFGFDREELAGLARALGGRGVDRMVPIGNALGFHRVWDGVDLPAEFSRLVTIQ
ncbi:acyl-CoA reductase [Nonomuraea sp. NPDC050691]|uniref:acyl-CoA reductase n=1 Tax=Nonomuraea sp. NPDC050691 TaxID=3155661 RepID=UPI0033C3DA4E